ncbi:hypothetical protein CE91St17_07860 [Alistipes onderdonkii]|nr:hypothetical protein CE91St18_12430 [Alistipes onderdonkii]GKG95724.1 hypothetical protein CE91St17_07860 [Alistipes onderdonkii]
MPINIGTTIHKYFIFFRLNNKTINGIDNNIIPSRAFAKKQDRIAENNNHKFLLAKINAVIINIPSTVGPQNSPFARKTPRFPPNKASSNTTPFNTLTNNNL